MTLTRSIDETISVQLIPATIGARARAVIIDGVLVSILAVLFMGASILFLDHANLGVLAGILAVLVLLREVDLIATGRSLGGRLAGVRFVDARTGGAPGIGMFFHADLVLVTIVPTIGFGSFLLLSSAAKNPDGRGWHDRVSGLMAVSTAALAQEQDTDAEPSAQSSSGDLEEVSLDLFGDQVQEQPESRTRRRGAHAAPSPETEAAGQDQDASLPPTTPRFHAVPADPLQDLSPAETLSAQAPEGEAVSTGTGSLTRLEPESEAFVVVPPQKEVQAGPVPADLVADAPGASASGECLDSSLTVAAPQAQAEAPGAVDPPDSGTSGGAGSESAFYGIAPETQVDQPAPDAAQPVAEGTEPAGPAPTGSDADQEAAKNAAPMAPVPAYSPELLSPMPARSDELAPTPESAEDEVPGAMLPDATEADLDTAAAEPLVVPPLAASKAAGEALEPFNASPEVSSPSPDFVAVPPEAATGAHAIGLDSALSPAGTDVPTAPRSAPPPSEHDDHYEVIQEVFARRAAARAAARKALSAPDQAAAGGQRPEPSSPSAPSPDASASPASPSPSTVVDDTLIDPSLADGRTTDEPMIVVPEGESLDSYFAQSLIADDPEPFSASSPDSDSGTETEPVLSEGTDGPSPAFVDDRESPVMRLMPFTNSGQAVQILGPTIIGRAPVNTSRYPQAQLVALGDSTPSVSKTHAALMPTDHGVLVTDLGSSNGTRVVRKGRARRIPQDVAVMVHEGGVVLLGQTAYRVQR